MKGALEVIQQIPTYISHVGTLRARKRVALNPEARRKQGAKAPRESTESPRSWLCKTPGKQKLHGQHSQEAFLEEGHRNRPLSGRARLHLGKPRTEKQSHCF